MAQSREAGMHRRSQEIKEPAPALLEVMVSSASKRAVEGMNKREEFIAFYVSRNPGGCFFNLPMGAGS